MSEHTEGSQVADLARRVKVSQSPEETAEWGRRLAPLLQPGDVIALRGELGAGKTTFVQGLARGLGITRPVTSPTFILINEYPSRPRLYHVDCYRIAEAAEAWGIGLDELIDDDGVCVIEWAERVAPLLPAERLEVVLTWTGPQTRRIEIVGYGPRPAALVRSLNED